MNTTTISPKFQIVIPKQVREKMNLNSGMKIEVIPYEDRIELIPIRSVKRLKGAFKGMDTTIKRDKDRL